MKKRGISFWWILLILIPVSLATLYIYLSGAGYYGPLLVRSSGNKVLSLIGRTPLGTSVEIGSGSSPVSTDPRFYHDFSVFHPGGADTLHMSCGNFVETQIINSDEPLIIRWEPEQNTNYGIIRKCRDLIFFAYYLPWVRIVLLILALLMAVIFIRRSRQRVISLFYEYARFIIFKIISVTPGRRLIFSLIWSIVIGVLIFLFGNQHLAPSQKVRFDDFLHLKHNPDQMDYQTIAVNFALHEEFMINGIKGQPELYRIIIDSTGNAAGDRINYNRLHYIDGLISLHRFPAYPIALGFLYRVFGVHPLIIKILQSLLLILSVCLIPLMGYKIWKNRGFLAGLLATPFFIASVFPLVDSFAPDLVTLCLNVLITFLYINYRMSPKWKGLILFSLTASLSILFKASIMFLVPVIFLDIAFMSFRFRKFHRVHRAFAFLFLFGVFWLPYNVWSVRTSGINKQNAHILMSAIHSQTDPAEIQRIINSSDAGRMNQIKLQELNSEDIRIFNESISPYVDQAGVINLTGLPQYTRNSILLGFYKMATMHDDFYFMIMLYPINGGLHCHNEYIYNGRENDEWVFDPDSHYNQDGLKGAYWTRRVLNFYRHNPSEIFRIALVKMRSVSLWAPVIPVSVFIFYIWFGLHLYRKRPDFKKIWGPLVFIHIAIAGLLFTDASVILFILMLILMMSMKSIRKTIPLPLTLLSTCIVLMPLITVAVARYTTYYYFPLFLISAILLLNIRKMGIPWLIMRKPRTSHTSLSHHSNSIL